MITTKKIWVSRFIIVGVVIEIVAIWGYTTANYFTDITQAMAVSLGIIGLIPFLAAYLSKREKS